MSVKQNLFALSVMLTSLYSCTQSKQDSSASNPAAADSTEKAPHFKRGTVLDTQQPQWLGWGCSYVLPSGALSSVLFV